MSKQKKCKNFDTCGNYKPQIAQVSGMCNSCAAEYNRNKPKKISELKRSTLKRTPLKRSRVKPTLKSLDARLTSILRFEEYVKRKIENEISRNKKVICAECGKLITTQYIPKTFGFNVAHLISKGSDVSVYYLQENSIFLCRDHHWQLDHGDCTKLRIWPQIEELKESIRANKESFLLLPHNQYNKFST